MSGHRTDLPAEKPDLSAESVLFNALSASIAPACPEESHVHDLRGRLLARARRSHERAQCYACVHREDGAWETLMKGVRIKVLNDRADARSILMDLDPGVAMPSHRHHQHEECVVLKGDAQLGDIEVNEGDYQIAPAGSRHATGRTRNGALLYLRGVSIGNRLAVMRDLAAAWIPSRKVDPLVVRSGNEAWNSVAAGVHIKPLWQDECETSFLMRLEPGACLNADARAQHEECLVVSGEIFCDDTLLRAHDYQFSRDGTHAREICSDVGAVLFMRGARTAD